MDDADTENMNPEDLYRDFKSVQRDIHNLTIDAHHHSDDLKKERDTTSQVLLIKMENDHEKKQQLRCCNVASSLEYNFGYLIHVL